MRKPPGDDKQGKRHAPSRRDADQQRRNAPVARGQDAGARPRDAGAPWLSSDRDIQDRYSSR